MAAQFDPTVISAIPDYAGNPVNAQMKALTLKDMMDRSQLNQLQVGAAKREASEAAQVKEILKNSDYSTPEGLAATAAKVNKISPRASMDLLKQGQAYESGQIQNQIDQLTLMDKRQELVVTAIDPVIATASQMKQQGASDLDIKAYITSQVPQAIQRLRGMQMPDGKPALSDDMLKNVTAQAQNGGYTLEALTSWERGSKAGQAQIKQRLEQLKADTAVKAEQTKERHETEVERADRAREGHQQRQEDIQRNKVAGFDDRQSELLASLADRNVSLPAGLRSQAQIRSTLDGLLKKHADLTPDQIADGIKSGKLKLAAETKGAQTAGTQIGKVALAANELNSFGEQTLEASAKVPRRRFVPWNQLKQLAASKISSPELLRFRAKMQALENAYNQLAARSGTDVDKRAHIHQLFDTANSPEAVATLVQALREEAVGAREAAVATIAETSGTAIPGAGASPGQPSTPPASGGGAPAPGALRPGNTYRHKSGATVEILEEGQ